MTVHLVKLCVGAATVEELAEWQAMKAHRKIRGGESCAFHTTFQEPKRRDELLDGGSLYWVIKGTILVRQTLKGVESGTKADGSRCCILLLDPKLTLVQPQPRRAFQGWRYLDAADAPRDIKRGAKNEVAAMPPVMRKRLADLGLI